MSWRDALDTLKQEAVAKEPAYAKAYAYGWQLLLSIGDVDDESRWHLSMMLHPKGRSSTEKDWHWMGRMAAYLGAPEEPLIMNDDANAPIHWNWAKGTQS